MQRYALSQNDVSLQLKPKDDMSPVRNACGKFALSLQPVMPLYI